MILCGPSARMSRITLMMLDTADPLSSPRWMFSEWMTSAACEGFAVVELDPLAQVENPAPCAVGGLPRFGQLAIEVAVGVDDRQVVADLPAYVDRVGGLQRPAVERVGGGPAAQGLAQCAAAFGRGGEGRVEAQAGRDDPSRAEGGAGFQKFPTVISGLGQGPGIFLRHGHSSLLSAST